MDQYTAKVGFLYGKYEKIEFHLLQLQDLLNEIFSDNAHPKQQFAFGHLYEVLKVWKVMVQLQRSLINKAEQDTLVNSIEIAGLPEYYVNDNEGVAQVLSQFLHISIPESYVVSFNRIGELTENGPPRPLAVHLIDENIKNRILTVTDSIMVGMTSYDMPLEITEHLTVYTRELLTKARQEGRKRNMTVWVKDGKVYFSSAPCAPTFEITCEADIQQMSFF